jgi:hypothetical protein
MNMARAKSPPRGLAFLERIAELVCSEYDFAHDWTREGETHILNVQCGPTNLSFLFDSEVLDDPGSEEYRTIAEKLLERLLSEFKTTRVTTQ